MLLRMQSGAGCVRPCVHAVSPLLRGASGRRSTGQMRCITQADPFASSTLSNEMKEALKAVRLASKACMAVQRTLASTNVNTKDDDSPVTVAGMADHHTICKLGAAC